MRYVPCRFLPRDFKDRLSCSGEIYNAIAKCSIVKDQPDKGDIPVKFVCCVRGDNINSILLNSDNRMSTVIPSDASLLFFDEEILALKESIDGFLRFKNIQDISRTSPFVQGAFFCEDSLYVLVYLVVDSELLLSDSVIIPNGIESIYQYKPKDSLEYFIRDTFIII